MANNHTVEKIGGSSMSRFAEVMNNVIVGQRKADVMADRIRDINPDCQLTLLTDFLTPENIPELLPPDKEGKIAQKTEEVIGPYELHDFFLYHFIKYGAEPAKLLYLAGHAFGETYSPEVIEKWLKVFLRRFFQQQFKRNCMPDGPKVGTIALSPRGDWRMPSDASGAEWLNLFN